MLKTIPEMDKKGQILQRLYFPSMHSREDAVEDPETGTFSWLLGGAESVTSIDNESQDCEEVADQSVESEDTNGLSYTASSEGSLDRFEQGSHDVQRQCDDRTSPPEFESTSPSSTHETDDEDEHYESARSVQSGSTSQGENEDDDEDEVFRERESGSLDEQSLAPSEGSYALSSSDDYSDYELDEEQLEIQQKFLHWLESGHEIFHISGKAGSGKSTLMKYICSHSRTRIQLKKWAGSKKLVFATFFFWSSGAREQRSLEGLYRSLLFEITNQCPELIVSLFQQELLDNSPVPLRFAIVKKAVERLFTKNRFPHSRICLFIDGLDEFEGDGTEQFHLAMNLKQWAASKDVKICASSRPHTQFLTSFDDRQRIHLQELTSKDVRLYTSMNIKKEPNHKLYRDDEIRELINTIDWKADGVFLWVRLVVRSILDGIRYSYPYPVLRKELDDTPTELDDLFDQLFNSIDKSDRELSDKVLLLVATAPSRIPAIRLSWLQRAQETSFPFASPIYDYTDAEIESKLQEVEGQLDGLSKGLLEVAEENFYARYVRDIYTKKAVQFIHRSAYDYVRAPERLNKMRTRLPLFDASRTLQQLSLATFQFRTAQSSDRDLLPNSAMMFFDLLKSEDLPVTVLSHFEEIFEVHKNKVCVHSNQHSFQVTTISLYSRARLYPVVGLGFIERGLSIYERKPFADFSLINYFAFYGQSNFIEARLSRNANLLSQKPEIPLLLSAVAGGKHEVVRVLLEQGASPYDLVQVHPGESKSDDTNNSERLTVWAATLGLILTVHLKKYSKFKILEEFLRRKVESRVQYVVRQVPPTRRAQDLNASPIPEETFLFSLEEFVTHSKAYNKDTLLELLSRGKSSWLWNRMSETLQNMGMRKSVPNIMSNCEPLPYDFNPKGGHEWRLRGVLVGNEYTEFSGAADVF